MAAENQCYVVNAYFVPKKTPTIIFDITFYSWKHICCSVVCKTPIQVNFHLEQEYDLLSDRSRHNHLLIILIQICIQDQFQNEIFADYLLVYVSGGFKSEDKGRLARRREREQQQESHPQAETKITTTQAALVRTFYSKFDI